MVSILIPCYNGKQYIKRCLDSCINQTYKDIEIIVVNDGSTDNSVELIKQYQSQDKRIKLVNQTNKGLAETRNVLLSHVKTKYCFFLDIDDWIDNDCIELYMQAINDNDLVVNSCFINKKNKDKVFYITNKINANTNNESYLINNTPFAWGILFRTDYLKGNGYCFNGKYPFFEDAGIMSYIIYKTNKIAFLNQPKYHYFINLQSLSRTKMSKAKIEQAINQLKNFYNWINKDFKKSQRYPKCINDQLAFYHCVVFTYIKYQSNATRRERKELKASLKQLEKQNKKIRYPSRYWKWWYFLLYRLCRY